MPPRQSFPSGPGPQQPQQPQQPPTPQAPSYGYGASPQFQPQQSQQPFQQNPNGPYEVVPPPAVGPNNGKSGHNPYEFIVAPNMGKMGRSPMSLSSPGVLFKMALLVGGLVILMIVVAVVISSLGPKSSTPGLESIAERQQEIMRVATEAAAQTQNQDAKNFVANVNATVSSSQTNVIKYLSAHGTKLGGKQLNFDKNTQTDTQLTAALSANNYDGAVTQQLTSQLQTYDTLLQTTFSQSSNTALKQMLQADYAGNQLLLQQSKAVEAELGN